MEILFFIPVSTEHPVLKILVNPRAVSKDIQKLLGGECENHPRFWREGLGDVLLYTQKTPAEDASLNNHFLTIGQHVKGSAVLWVFSDTPLHAGNLIRGLAPPKTPAPES